MNTRKTGFIYRSASVLTGAFAAVIVSLASSLGSVAQAYTYDLKGFSPAQCRTFGPYSSAGVYYYHDSVHNTSGDYAYVICPAIMEAESFNTNVGVNVYFNKATASQYFYCYVFSVNLASSSSRWYYMADNTTAGTGGLYMGSIPGFKYGSVSVVCGLPPQSKLLNYYGSVSWG